MDRTFYLGALVFTCVGLALLTPACGEENGGGTESAASSSSTSDASSTAASSGGGGAGGSGSASSGSSSGAGGSGGSPSAGCKDLPLCDDFEDDGVGGPPSAERWAIVSPNCSGSGTIAVDGAFAKSGTKSVKVSGGGSYCDHVFLAHDKSLAGIGGVIYGRFFVRFDAPLGDGHTTFMTMKDTADGGKDLRMGGQNKILMWNRESDDATLPSLSPAGVALSVMPPSDAWVCIEFMANQTNGFLTTWVDGTEVQALHLDGMPTPDVDQQWLNQKPTWKPSLVDFKLGWEGYAGQAMTLWFDDIALASERVGCGAP